MNGVAYTMTADIGVLQVRYARIVVGTTTAYAMGTPGQWEPVFRLHLTPLGPDGEMLQDWAVTTHVSMDRVESDVQFTLSVVGLLVDRLERVFGNWLNRPEVRPQTPPH